MRYEDLKYSDDILPIIFRRDERLPSVVMHLHWHEAVELVLILRGEMYARNNGDSLRVPAGEIVCVHSNHLHCYDPVGESVEYYCFILPSQVIGSRALYQSPLPYHTKDEKSLALYREAVSVMEQKPPFYRETVKGLLMQLYARLANLQGEQTVADDRRMTAAVKAAMAYINEHLAQELDVDRVAEHVGVSRYHLCHLFKTVTGRTLAHYWQTVRCTAARKMLKKGASVAQAAEACGFASPAYFSKVYQKHFSVLPSADKM